MDAGKERANGSTHGSATTLRCSCFFPAAQHPRLSRKTEERNREEATMEQQPRQHLRRRTHSTSALSDTTLLSRTLSEKEAQGSHKLLVKVETGTVDEVRSVLAKIQGSERSVLTASSLVADHGQRTPFMAAVRRGDLPIFTALLHYFDRLFSNDGQAKCWRISDSDDCPQDERDAEMRDQLARQDTSGMTLGMLAARGNNVSILSMVMAEIQHTRAKFALEETDFEGMSLLLHAAGSGSAPIFQIVFRAMESTFPAEDGGVGPHLTRQSGDGKTIFMHAAKGGSAMALRTVARSVRRACDPQTVRHLLYQTDATGMNFLMHSAACWHCPHPPAPRAALKMPVGDNIGESSSGRTGPDIEPGPPPPQLKRTSSTGTGTWSVGLGDDPAQKAQEAAAAAQKPDPAVPVFNIALDIVKKCLWKGQVREHLTATDLSGWTILAHSLRSGHCQLFEAALRAVREDVLDAEVEEMLEISSDELESTPLRSALEQGGREIQTKFEKARHQVKKQVSMRAKLSTIEAKIQSFIPGKLIVIFQLLLPVTESTGRLYLLIVMCCLAPLFNWANSLLMKEKPASENQATAPRKSKISLLLGAPALFCWGVGTSDIGLTFGWNESRSAAVLAVATIIVPATDAFFNSRSVELWYEQWSCQKKRFVQRAEREWRRRTTRPLEKGYEMRSIRHNEIGHILRQGADPGQSSRRSSIQPLTPSKESAEENI